MADQRAVDSETAFHGVPISVVQNDTVPFSGAAMILVQEAWGVNGHLRDVAARLAALGYLAVMPHLYWRGGDPVLADFNEARPQLNALTGQGIAQDITAAREYLTSRSVSHVGALGFCMGGSVALWAASQSMVDAAVTFYGGGIRSARWEGFPTGLESIASLRVPWLGHYGLGDASIPAADVAALQQRAPEVATIVTYPDAGHAFFNDTSPNYRSDDATTAWSRTVTFFGEHLGHR